LIILSDGNIAQNVNLRVGINQGGREYENRCKVMGNNYIFKILNGVAFFIAGSLLIRTDVPDYEHILFQRLTCFTHVAGIYYSFSDYYMYYLCLKGLNVYKIELKNVQFIYFQLFWEFLYSK
jgi:hypothetical protein